MKKILVVVVALLALAGLLSWWYAESTFSVPFQAGERVTEWSFEGALAHDPASEERIREDIKKLEDSFGSAEDGGTDYTRYVGLAQDYEMLGDGKRAYDYLTKALAIDSSGTGLAWHNMGVLLDRLGVPATARYAFSRAVDAQPQIMQYHTAQLEYLTERFPDDTRAIEAAFDEATTVFGEQPSLLELRARWYARVGRKDEAIAEWEKIKLLSPSAAEAVDMELRDLRK